MATKEKTVEETETETKTDVVDETKTDVAVRQTSSEVATVDFGDDAGLGMEDVSRDEFIIPFLRVLQTNSPQVDDTTGMPGAKAGMIINLGTNELIDGKSGFTFIPVHRDHNFVEFIPRNLGGGFVGIHDVDDPDVAALRATQGAFGKLFTSDKKTNEGLPAEGTEIGEQFYLYGLLVADEGFVSRVVIAFGSTQIKKYKGFIGRVDNIRYVGGNGQPVKPPLWAHRWRFTTVAESNKKGKFYGWAIGLAERNEDGSEAPTVKSLLKRSDPLYVQGREFYDLIKGGGAKVDYAKAAEAEAEASEGGGGDIPM